MYKDSQNTSVYVTVYDPPFLRYPWDMYEEKLFHRAFEELTPRRRKVLELFLAGRTDAEIALELFVAETTVRKHVQNICWSFDLGGRHQRRDLKDLIKRYKPELLREAPQENPIQEKSNSNADTPTVVEEVATVSESPDNGPVGVDSPFYIERPPAESRSYEKIVLPGALIRIKAPRQMGKTSLLNRILAYAGKQGYQTVSLNMEEVEEAKLDKVDNFLRWFSAYVTRKLNLQPQLDNYWDEEIYGSKVSCKTYFECYLLQQIDTPMVLGLDGVDRLFPYTHISHEFFAMLRNWHEEAKTKDIWRKLRLVVAHSTEDYGKLNINQSPFNVGEPIELTEFTTPQAQELARRHGLDGKNTPVPQLMEIVGGHPYLIRLAFYRLALGEVKLEDLLRDATTDAGIYNAHLRRHLATLQQQPKLAAALQQVISQSEPVKIDTMQGYKLDSMGLIKRLGDNSSPRCQLYRIYFSNHLGVQ
uniref:Serine/threonine protein kinase n=1 Tax=Planktothricoides sp. SpSt-374 TaxID=2282167 RepID=A0A7C3VJW6_9CYAN